MSKRPRRPAEAIKITNNIKVPAEVENKPVSEEITFKPITNESFDGRSFNKFFIDEYGCWEQLKKR